MWVTDFSDCNHPAAHSYPVLYSQHINLDKQDGAFDIYSGRRSENHLPRRLHYLSIISTRQKTFPTFWDWGQERGDCGSLLQPVHLHWVYTFLLVHFPIWIFTEISKNKACSEKKHTHTPSSLFSLGKVQNCKKTEKYFTSVWEEKNKN